VGTGPVPPRGRRRAGDHPAGRPRAPGPPRRALVPLHAAPDHWPGV
ncbi:MAG: hypothetical protein AVDCRST_MAG49-2336, partial [uncultured Thermomicrobiales bacterium]